MLDSRWKIWDNQALTVAELSHTNGNFLDLEEGGVTDESLPIELVLDIEVGTTFGGMASGVMIQVITSDSATAASGQLAMMGIGCTAYPILVAELVAGARFSVSAQVYNLNKYLFVSWEPVSQAGSSGTLDVWFGTHALTQPKVQKFPDGYA